MDDLESADFEIPGGTQRSECIVRVKCIGTGLSKPSACNQWTRHGSKTSAAFIGQFVTDVVAIKIPI